MKLLKGELRYWEGYKREVSKTINSIKGLIKKT